MVACKVDSSLKGINDFPSWGAPHLVEEAKEAKRRNVPNYLSTLIREAKARNVNLITLPMGMTRQKENKTRYLVRKGGTSCGFGEVDSLQRESPALIDNEEQRNGSRWRNLP